MWDKRTDLGDLLYDLMCKGAGVAAPATPRKPKKDPGAVAPTGQKTVATAAVAAAKPAVTPAAQSTPAVEAAKPAATTHGVPGAGGAASSAQTQTHTSTPGEKVDVSTGTPHVKDPNNANKVSVTPQTPASVNPPTNTGAAQRGKTNKVHKYAYREMQPDGGYKYGDGPAPENKSVEHGNFHVHAQGMPEEVVESRPWLRRTHQEPPKNSNPHSRAQKTPTTKHESSMSSLGKAPKVGEEINLGALNGKAGMMRVHSMRHDDGKGGDKAGIHVTDQHGQEHHWNSLMEGAFGDHYVGAVDNRLKAHARAIYNHAPRDLLHDIDLTGHADIHETVKALKAHADQNYQAYGKKLEKALKTAGVEDSSTAKSMINYLSTRRGWHADARAGLLGACINGQETARIAKNYKRIILAAERHAGKGMVTSATIANIMAHKDFTKLAGMSATDDIGKHQDDKTAKLQERDKKKLQEVNKRLVAAGEKPIDESHENYEEALKELKKSNDAVNKAKKEAEPPKVAKTPEEREKAFKEAIRVSAESAHDHIQNFENLDNAENPLPSERGPNGMGTAKDAAGKTVSAEDIQAQQAADHSARVDAGKAAEAKGGMTPEQKAALAAVPAPTATTAGGSSTVAAVTTGIKGAKGKTETGEVKGWGLAYKKAQQEQHDYAAGKWGADSKEYKQNIEDSKLNIGTLQWLQTKPEGTTPEQAVQASRRADDDEASLGARLAFVKKWQARLGKDQPKVQAAEKPPAAPVAQTATTATPATVAPTAPTATTATPAPVASTPFEEAATEHAAIGTPEALTHAQQTDAFAKYADEHNLSTEDRESMQGFVDRLHGKGEAAPVAPTAKFELGEDDKASLDRQVKEQGARATHSYYENDPEFEEFHKNDPAHLEAVRQAIYDHVTNKPEWIEESNRPATAAPEPVAAPVDPSATTAAPAPVVAPAAETATPATTAPVEPPATPATTVAAETTVPAETPATPATTAPVAPASEPATSAPEPSAAPVDAPAKEPIAPPPEGHSQETKQSLSDLGYKSSDVTKLTPEEASKIIADKTRKEPKAPVAPKAQTAPKEPKVAKAPTAPVAEAKAEEPKAEEVKPKVEVAPAATVAPAKPKVEGHSESTRQQLTDLGYTKDQQTDLSTDAAAKVIKDRTRAGGSKDAFEAVGKPWTPKPKSGPVPEAKTERQAEDAAAQSSQKEEQDRAAEAQRAFVPEARRKPAPAVAPKPKLGSPESVLQAAPPKDENPTVVSVPPPKDHADAKDIAKAAGILKNEEPKDIHGFDELGNSTGGGKDKRFKQGVIGALEAIAKDPTLPSLKAADDATPKEGGNSRQSVLAAVHAAVDHLRTTEGIKKVKALVIEPPPEKKPEPAKERVAPVAEVKPPVADEPAAGTAPQLRGADVTFHREADKATGGERYVVKHESKPTNVKASAEEIGQWVRDATKSGMSAHDRNNVRGQLIRADARALGVPVTTLSLAVDGAASPALDAYNSPKVAGGRLIDALHGGDADAGTVKTEARPQSVESLRRDDESRATIKKYQKAFDALKYDPNPHVAPMFGDLHDGKDVDDQLENIVDHEIEFTKGLDKDLPSTSTHQQRARQAQAELPALQQELATTEKLGDKTKAIVKWLEKASHRFKRILGGALAAIGVMHGATVHDAEAKQARPVMQAEARTESVSPAKGPTSDDLEGDMSGSEDGHEVGHDGGVSRDSERQEREDELRDSDEPSKYSSSYKGAVYDEATKQKLIKAAAIHPMMDTPDNEKYPQVTKMFSGKPNNTGNAIADRAIASLDKGYGFPGQGRRDEQGNATKSSKDIRCSEFVSKVAGTPYMVTTAMYHDAVTSKKHWSRVEADDVKAGDVLIYPHYKAKDGTDHQGHTAVIVNPDTMEVIDSSESGAGVHHRAMPPAFTVHPETIIARAVHPPSMRKAFEMSPEVLA